MAPGESTLKCGRRANLTPARGRTRRASSEERATPALRAHASSPCPCSLAIWHPDGRACASVFTEAPLADARDAWAWGSTSASALAGASAQAAIAPRHRPSPSAPLFGAPAERSCALNRGLSGHGPADGYHRPTTCAPARSAAPGCWAAHSAHRSRSASVRALARSASTPSRTAQRSTYARSRSGPRMRRTSTTSRHCLPET